MKTNKKRILVVDDGVHMTTLIRLLLEKTRVYEVRVENASTRALAVAEEFQPDLIRLDVDMPVMDGGELASCLSDSPCLSTVPVVFLTGSITKQEVAERSGLIGGLPFLAKPLDATEMLGCLKRQLEGQSSVPSEVPFAEQKRK